MKEIEYVFGWVGEKGKRERRMEKRKKRQKSDFFWLFYMRRFVPAKKVE